MKKTIIAIDLHGTLLDLDWTITKKSRDELISLLNKMKANFDFYICTGNDFTFVEKYIDKEILKTIHGYILESGCVVYKSHNKTLLTDDITIRKAKEIEEHFISLKLPFIKHFAKRETSVSIFTYDENGGEEPVKHFETIFDILSKHKHADSFYATWSNVAIDIIPNGYTKWTALKECANDSFVISFMDSNNDKEIALNSDLCIMPNNVSHELIAHLRNNNKLVYQLDKFHFLRNNGYITESSYTKGVIEGLKYLKSQDSLPIKSKMG